MGHHSSGLHTACGDCHPHLLPLHTVRNAGWRVNYSNPLFQYLQPTQFIQEENGVLREVAWGTEGAVNLVGYDNTVQDMYVPFFAIMKFIFYFGWLNVAETLINPFGDDDEDFEVNAIINRNVQIGYMMVDGEEERFYAEMDDRKKTTAAVDEDNDSLNEVLTPSVLTDHTFNNCISDTLSMSNFI